MTALVDVREAAKLLAIGQTTLRGHVAAGRIAHRRVGGRVLFTSGDLEAFVEACAVPVRGPATKPMRVVAGDVKPLAFYLSLQKQGR